MYPGGIPALALPDLRAPVLRVAGGGTSLSVYAHCPKCGNFDLEPISRERVEKGNLLAVKRLLRVPGLPVRSLPGAIFQHAPIPANSSLDDSGRRPQGFGSGRHRKLKRSPSPDSRAFVRFSPAC